MTTDEVIDDVLTRDDGFVAHHADKGGATKMGITAGTPWRIG